MVVALAGLVESGDVAVLPTPSRLDSITPQIVRLALRGWSTAGPGLRSDRRPRTWVEPG